jgi:hypothetical protein
MKKTLLASGVAMALGAPGAYASGMNDLFANASFTTAAANFTMLAANGGTVGGTNDVAMTWDGDGFNASSDYTGPGSYANVTASSTAPFFGYTWTAHDIQVFVPGTYSFNTTLGGGNAEAGTLTATVGAGQLGMHMLFDWNGNLNIDVFVVAANGSVFGTGVASNTSGLNAKCSSSFTGTIKKNCLFDGPYYGGPVPTGDHVWMLASIDPDGDGVNGISMAAGGPFAFFNANFNADMSPIGDVSDIPVAAVPVPAAVWLFGSGLLGLVGIARRKKRA